MNTVDRKLALTVLFGFWTLMALLGFSQIYLGSMQMGEPFKLGQSILRSFPPYLLWAVLTPLIFWLGQRFRVDRDHWRRTLPVHLLASAVIALLYLLGMAALSKYVLTSPSGEDEPFLTVLQYYLYSRFHFTVLIYMAVLGIGYAFEYYHKFREREVQASKLETQLAQARVQALEMQLHPHFLFNTLHAVSALMDEDVEAARNMLALLSELLRMTLDGSDQQEVDLRRELAFIERYLDIQQIRFGDRLRVSFEVHPEAWEARVPHLILQPLVENAIRHGRAPEGETSTLLVQAHRIDDTLRLQVTDNGPGLSSANGHPLTDEPRPGNGIGLSNTRARLQQLYGDDASLTFSSPARRGLTVSLNLPFYTEGEALEIVTD